MAGAGSAMCSSAQYSNTGSDHAGRPVLDGAAGEQGLGEHVLFLPTPAALSRKGQV